MRSRRWPQREHYEVSRVFHQRVCGGGLKLGHGIELYADHVEHSLIAADHTVFSELVQRPTEVLVDPKKVLDLQAQSVLRCRQNRLVSVDQHGNPHPNPHLTRDTGQRRGSSNTAAVAMASKTGPTSNRVAIDVRGTDRTRGRPWSLCRQRWLHCWQLLGRC